MSSNHSKSNKRDWSNFFYEKINNKIKKNNEKEKLRQKTFFRA